MKFNQFLLTPYFGPGLLAPRADALDRRAGRRHRAAGADSPDRRRPAEEPDDRLPARGPPRSWQQVDRSLSDLESIVHKAGAAGCDALALPEDTLGLLKWESAHPTELDRVLPEAVKRMLDRLGKAAADHRMYLVVCNDAIEPDGKAYNTAFLLGRDGKEIGRYHKVNLPLAEQSRAPGA